MCPFPSPILLLRFRAHSVARGTALTRYHPVDGCAPLEPALFLSLARLAMESTIQMGPGRPVGGQRDG
jgi:hypothetical protein